MINQFVERVPANPNRKKIVFESGSIDTTNGNYATIEYADDPITIGTPLSASNLNQLVDKINDLENDLFYKSGDTFTLNTKLPCSGFISTTATGIYILIPTEKSMKNISSITIETLKGSVRGISGYVKNGSVDMGSGYDLKSNLTCTTVKANDNIIYLTIKKDSAFSNVTNNTPVSLELVDIILTFN